MKSIEITKEVLDSIKPGDKLLCINDENIIFGGSIKAGEVYTVHHTVPGFGIVTIINGDGKQYGFGDKRFELVIPKKIIG